VRSWLGRRQQEQKQVPSGDDKQERQGQRQLQEQRQQQVPFSTQGDDKREKQERVGDILVG
jgi:hypothetical protein